MTNETSKHAYTLKDDPAEKRRWVIVVEAMDHDQAVELGRVMGGMGLGGRFVSGGLANAALCLLGHADGAAIETGGGD